MYLLLVISSNKMSNRIVPKEKELVLLDTPLIRSE